MPNVLSPEKAIFDFTFLQILWKKYIFVFDSMTCFHFLYLRERFFVDFEVFSFQRKAFWVVCFADHVPRIWYEFLHENKRKMSIKELKIG